MADNEQQGPAEGVTDNEQQGPNDEQQAPYIRAEIECLPLHSPGHKFRHIWYTGYGFKTKVSEIVFVPP